MKKLIPLPLDRQKLAHLQRRWWLLALAWAALLLLGSRLLATGWPYSGRWLLLATPVAAYQLLLLRRALPQNHRPGETELLPTLGPGNHLTLLRGLALAALAGFLLSPWPDGGLAWLPALLYTGAGFADYLDGYLARRARHTTLLGEHLDIAFDSLGVLLVCLLAVWYGQLPLWYLPLGLGRYLFLAGIWWRRRRGAAVHPLPPSTHRRIFAGFHMGFLSVVLWPIIPPAGATVAGLIFGGATAASFLRDWAVVAGHLDPESGRYRRWQGHSYRLLARTLLPLLRLLLLASMIWLLLVLPDRRPPSWLATLLAWKLPLARPLAYMLLLAALTGTIAAFLGLIPRLAALLLLFPLGFDVITFGLRWPNALALAATLLLLLLGGGRAVLWAPERRFIYRRTGES